MQNRFATLKANKQDVSQMALDGMQRIFEYARRTEIYGDTNLEFAIINLYMQGLIDGMRSANAIVSGKKE